MLPVHFFTIVLNGEPFIRHHIEVFRRLPMPWHWHVVEGLADLKHDTSWSLSSGGRLPEQLHHHGRSIDGTTEYLDDLAQQHHGRVSIYRKPPGVIWDGKVEMVNAPLNDIQVPCLLWQVDADELWTVEQICAAHELFLERTEATAAFYLCRYFVGEKLVITTRDTYGNHLDYEWLRTWRFEPGMRWTSHEPPRLCRKLGTGDWQDVAAVKPLRHDVTEGAGLVFQHSAYVTESQLRFKELYYGYAKAVAQWRKLQSVERFPVRLREYFDWVKDDARVNTAASQGVFPIALRNLLGNWRFRFSDLPSDAPARIVWSRLDSIGDNVLAASTLPHIRGKYPHATLTVFCQEHIAELYEACPHVDEIVQIDLPRAREDKAYLQDFNRLWENRRPDLLLNSVFSRDPFTDRLIAATGAKIRIGLVGDFSNINLAERKKADQVYQHLLESAESAIPELHRHAGFLRGLDMEPGSLYPLVWTTSADEEFAEDTLKQRKLLPKEAIALFPGAQFDCKLYDGFLEALKPFADRSFLLLGGPKERERAAEFCRKNGAITHNLTGETTLRQMAAILRRCALLVATDSAAAHLAAAVGTPHVVVVGGGHFGRFLPYAATTSLVCLPLDCYQCNWVCKHSRVHCIQDIAPEVVSKAISETLRTQASKPRVFVQGYAKAGLREGSPRPVDVTNWLQPSAVEIIPVEAVPPVYISARLPIGVLIPTRNSGKFVGAHLEKTRPWAPMVEEIVVVDSFSTDDTVEAIKSGLEHPRLKVLSHPPGLYESWNYGLTQLTSRYSYIATVGDDISADGLRHLVEVAEQFQCDVVLSPPQFVREDGRVQLDKQWTIHQFIELCGVEEPTLISAGQFFLTSVLQGMAGFMGSSASNLYRTATLQERPFPTTCGHVGDTAWGVLNAFGVRVAITPRLCANFRIHPNAGQISEEEEADMSEKLLLLARETLAAERKSNPLANPGSAMSEVLDRYESLSRELRRARISYDQQRASAWPWFLRRGAWEARRERNRQRALLRDLWKTTLRSFQSS